MIGKMLGAYEILSHIGTGGMGEVYHARDTRLGRTVAIKVLNKEHMQRFEREAHAIAALNHPHICTLYDIGPDYLVMEHIDGTAIKGPLPVEEALRLAIQIASALDEAHRRGILHRDLKPGNIMVTRRGTAKLLDFGLAKLAAGAEFDTASTMDGTVMGTPAYMSPEQAQGKPVDERSDIFSFGAVLYEILSGSRAFDGTSTVQVLSAVLRDEPRPLQTLPQLGRIVMRCLAKQPAQRFRTMTEVKAALEQIAIKPSEAQPSIAVLPFVNMSGDKEQEYFSDGLAEEIINALTQIPGLRVIARTSAFAFKDKHEDIRRIAELLGVTTILEGSVRKAGNPIRITAQLITAADGSHLWSERYDRDMTDVFAIQDEISQAIAAKLRVRLAADRPLMKRHTQNLEAYHLYLRGRHCVWRMTAGSVAKGNEYLEKAIAIDPDYALAFSGISESYFMSTYWGFMHPKVALPNVRSTAMEALSLDGTLAEAHAMLGVAKGYGDFDWAGADGEFRRALELNPASPLVRFCYGQNFLRPIGQVDDALAQLKRAVELDPLSSPYITTVAWLYFVKGQNDFAVAQCQRAMDLDPGGWFPHLMLAVVHQHIKNLDEGLSEAQKACELSGRNALTLGALGQGYGLLGRASEAQSVLKELMTQSRTAYVPPYAMAAVYRGLGEMEQALEWLDKGVEERDVAIITGLKSDPRLTALRSHPRYHALLRKMNLEP
jgi:eukaryotic-like serine/threonine-protein kinase